jgi:glycolate oxidase FAD binding subunit
MDLELLKLREQIAVARQQRAPLRLRGGGTKDFYGERLASGSPNDAAELGTVLDLRSFHGIVDYEPSELVVTARCGTPLSQIEAALAQRDQFLGFEPPAFAGEPTLGGVIAAGLSGPRRMQAGAARDFVLGATLLNADGELLRFGGQVMKNVAGFDVPRLLCGSLGVFGIITELSIKVLPKPRAEQTLRLEMPAREAVEAFNRWGGQPLSISGAAWHAGIAWLRLSGALPAVRAACERIGGERASVTTAEEWWNGLRHCTHPAFSNASIWRVSLPSCAPPLDLPVEPLIDWGGALQWYIGDMLEFDVRKLAVAAGGTALRWRGVAPAGRFHPLTPAVAEIHRRLKRSFDPYGLFNPGRLLADL